MKHAVWWPEPEDDSSAKRPLQGDVISVDLPVNGLTEVVVVGYNTAGIVVNDDRSLVNIAKTNAEELKKVPKKGK